MHTARIGIVGAGQLGRMLGLAGYRLGIQSIFLGQREDSPAGQIGPIRLAELDDVDGLRALARSVDVLTFEIENVSVDALRALEGVVPVHPQPEIVALAQDRLTEKRLFESLGIPAAPFEPVDDEADLPLAADRLGWPIVLKARRLGYDGRGQRLADDLEGLRAAWGSIGRVPAIAEGFVEFDRELSLIGVRRAGEDPLFYPLTENLHADGILQTSMAPWEDDVLQRTAESWLTAIMNRFDYRGVLTVEFFSSGDGLVANEIAPRVHNSGHWTIEGAVTSQFENHLRAVLDWPLGETRHRGYAGMLNLLGRMPPVDHVLAVPGVHLHHYGKKPRPARKLGHCTLLASSREELSRRLESLRATVFSE